MKTVIMAGGLGTRLAEETEARPKPMVEVGGCPILWHIMKHYAHYGLKDFCIALGYKGEAIKRYFVDYLDLAGSMTVSLSDRCVNRHDDHPDDWTVRLVETGLNTQTGGRLQRLAPLLRGETFMMTYGDGVCDVDLGKLLEFHRSHGKLATLTAVHPPARFGALEFEGDRIVEFKEKPQIGEGWVNGGFYVLESKALDYLTGDDCIWEREPLERLAEEGQLMAYRHEAFWQCMDTLREKRLLESLWSSGKAPWKVWE